MIRLVYPKLSHLLLATSVILLSFSCEREAMYLPDIQQKSDQLDITNSLELQKPDFENQNNSWKQKQRALTEKQARLQEEIREVQVQRRIFRQENPIVGPRSSAAVLQVPADYPNLQAAVNAAQPGDKIILEGSVVDAGFVVVDVEDLTIQAEQPLGAALSAYVLLIQADRVMVKNLDLPLEAGATIQGSTGVVFKDNRIQSWEGMALFEAEGNTIQNLEIDATLFASFRLLNSNNNTIQNVHTKAVNGDMLSLEESNGNTFSNCSFSNVGTSFSGAYFYNSTGNIFKNCLVEDYGFVGFFCDFGSHSNQFSNCVATGGTYGFASYLANETLYQNCKSVNAGYTGIYIQNVSDVKIVNCEVQGAQVGTYLVFAEDNEVLNGNFHHNAYNGIELLGASDNLLEANNCYENTYNGILLNIYGINNDNTLIGNKTHDNGARGILLGSASGCTVQENVCNSNGAFGILLLNSENNTLESNKAHENTLCDVTGYVEAAPSTWVLQDPGLNDFINTSRKNAFGSFFCEGVSF